MGKILSDPSSDSMSHKARDCLHLRASVGTEAHQRGRDQSHVVEVAIHLLFCNFREMHNIHEANQ
jgi:hypothetical protein